jgi:uncharacterized protein (TIGR00251 family)
VVTPKASSNRIVKTEPDHFRVYVTTAPEDGKANKAVLKLLSKHLGVPKTSMTITRGTTSRVKTIHIDD